LKSAWAGCLPSRSANFCRRLLRINELLRLGCRFCEKCGLVGAALAAEDQGSEREAEEDRGAGFGHWIEKGRLVHPVHEITIAGNLNEILNDVDAVGNDLVFRGSSASPTLRVRRMTISGS